MMFSQKPVVVALTARPDPPARLARDECGWIAGDVVVRG